MDCPSSRLLEVAPHPKECAIRISDILLRTIQFKKRTFVKLLQKMATALRGADSLSTFCKALTANLPIVFTLYG